MKKLLFALALLCGLAPAASASLVVLSDYTDGDRARDTEVFQRVLHTQGVAYTLVPQSLATSTKARIDSLAVGKVNLYGSTWVEFDAVAIPGFRRGANLALDTLATIVARPHTKPFLILSDRQNSNALTTSADYCSTGVGNGTTVSSATNIAGYDPRSWRRYNIRLGTHYVRTASESSFGLFRRVLGKVSINQVTGEDVPSASMTEAPDSVFVWARMFANKDTGVPLVLAHISAGVAPRYLTAAPTIYCSTNENGQQGHSSVVLIGLSFLDSLSGGRVLRGSTPKRQAVFLERAFEWNTAAFDPADTATSVPYLTDSIPALGVPVGFGCPPESVGVASKAYAKRWLANSAYYPIPQGDSRTPNGNASSTYPCDLTAYSRNRQAHDDGTCDAAGDTSIACLLAYGAKRVQAAFTGKRVARVILGVGGQWRPIAGAATDLANVYGVGRMGTDSLFSAFAWAGYRVVLSNGREDPWWNASLLATDGAVFRVRRPSSGAGSGTPDTLPAYGQPVRIKVYMTGNSLTHDNAMWAQRARTDGANDPKVQYQSTAGCSAYRLLAGDLVSGAGGSGLVSSAKTFVAYREAKWIVAGYRIANAYCWRGNAVTRFVRADEL